jgi:hypothetical protein
MMTRNELRATLARMEDSLAETRRNLMLVEYRLGENAEAEAIRRRPKARYYHRRMFRWTGSDEAEFRRILDHLTNGTAAELVRLRRKMERQDAAIEALRRK